MPMIKYNIDGVINMLQAMTLDIISWLRFNFWWLFISLIFIIVLITVFLLMRKPKRQIVESIKDSDVQPFIDSYGGLSNIKHATLEGKRLKVQLNDVEKANLSQFKSLGATGIFVSGKNVKMVLPYDMQKLVNQINENKNGGL